MEEGTTLNSAICPRVAIVPAVSVEKDGGVWEDFGCFSFSALSRVLFTTKQTMHMLPEFQIKPWAGEQGIWADDHF